MQAQITFFGAKIGTKDCFLAKNGGLEALVAHSWARLAGLTSQAPGGWLEIEASVIIMSVLVGRGLGQPSYSFQNREKQRHGTTIPAIRVNTIDGSFRRNSVFAQTFQAGEDDI
jgi:hypothetical protein